MLRILRKYLVVLLIFAVTISCLAWTSIGTWGNSIPLREETMVQRKTMKTPVQKYGKISVKGVNQVDKDGEICQLRGVSTHGLSWYPQYVDRNGFASMRDQWGTDVVRLAMYTEGYKGYANSGAKNRSALRQTVYKGVDTATDLGMYVIVDWHILSDGNPNKHVSKAKDFFGRVSKKYKNQDNVIYEICNEPNGSVTWSQIKTYAKKSFLSFEKITPMLSSS